MPVPFVHNLGVALWHHSADLTPSSGEGGPVGKASGGSFSTAWEGRGPGTPPVTLYPRLLYVCAALFYGALISEHLPCTRHGQHWCRQRLGLACGSSEKGKDVPIGATCHLCHCRQELGTADLCLDAQGHLSSTDLCLCLCLCT